MAALVVGALDTYCCRRVELEHEETADIDSSALHRPIAQQTGPELELGQLGPLARLFVCSWLLPAAAAELQEPESYLCWMI